GLLDLPGVLFQGGRLLREAPLLGFALHGRDGEPPSSLSRGRQGSPALLDCDRFLKRSRGSRCAPPGLQSRPRFSSGGFGARCAACASPGGSPRRPRANHFTTTSTLFRFNWCNVGSSSSRSRARRAVSLCSLRLVQ